MGAVGLERRKSELNTGLKLLPTLDGSATFFDTEYNQTFHSTNGAIQEAKHVFVEAGMDFYLKNNPNKTVKILEVGFGTGLNFLVSADYAHQHNIPLHYRGLETRPVPEHFIHSSNYADWIKAEDIWQSYSKNYSNIYHASTEITPSIFLKVDNIAAQLVELDELVDIIYYDAFAPNTQPEMWQENVIEHVCKHLKPGGVFVTYSITGKLNRCLKSMHFIVSKPKGAAGKREMCRAVKM